MALQRRVQQPQHFRPLLQPARHFEARFVVPLQPHPERAQAAQSEINVVRSDMQTVQAHEIA